VETDFEDMFCGIAGDFLSELKSIIMVEDTVTWTKK